MDEQIGCSAPRSKSIDLCLQARVFESSNEGIVIASRKRVVVAANAAFARLSGYTIAELVGMKLDSLRAAATGMDVLGRIASPGSTERRWVGQALGRTKAGREQPIELSIVRITHERSREKFYICTCADVAGRTYAEARIQHMAFFDSLTGLPNRAYLVKRFESLAAGAAAAGGNLAVVFLDLDGFKEVNDTLGHTAGDAMIAQIAQRMCAGASPDTLVCRFGGDEFILILSGRDGKQAACRVRELLARISKPVTLEGRNICVTASAGISVFPKDGSDVERLVRHADTALHQAKTNGKNTIVTFSLEMDVALSRRFDLLSALRSAVDRDELVLRFQPIIDTANGAVVAAEALVYWDHPKFGMIGPATFIPLAEESGLIEAVGEWVLDAALEEYSTWEARGLPKIGLAVNVSGFQLSRLDRIESRIRAAAAAGIIEPRNLVLEITERHFVHNLKAELPALQSLCGNGVGLAIDDFGTGYSNLNYLKDLPITQIKIDISFIRNLVGDAGDRVIVKAIVDLARSLRLRVVAEGVETAEQLEILQEYGCTDVQGFLFSRPLPSEEFIGFVRSRHATEARDATTLFPIRQRSSALAEAVVRSRWDDEEKDWRQPAKRRIPMIG